MNTACQIISYLLLNAVAFAEIYFDQCLRVMIFTSAQTINILLALPCS